jgi:hypothetical protein
MKSALVALMCACVALAASSGVVAQPFSGDLYSDSIPPGILGTGVWIDPGVSHLHWDVAQEASGIWDYDYTFTVPSGEISHLILETSTNLTGADIFDVTGTFSGTEINTFTPDGSNSNPNMPGPIYGIKFDNVNTTEGTFSFRSFREPVWGDFYAKDGTAGDDVDDEDVFNTAWNAGFLDADPTEPASSGSIDHHLLVPDSAPPVPDASTFMLACVGALPVLAAARRRIFR